MIRSKKDLKRYLEQDARALGNADRKRPKLFGDDVWKFQILLRKFEYYTNMKKSHRLLRAPAYLLCRYRFKVYSLRLGFYIPANVFDEGLSIPHYGTIVINGAARVGKNCRLHEGVNIGATNGSKKAPIIGDNVFIATGAKIIGDITIADNVVIGANAVVVKSIEEEGVTYAGVPAKKISDNSSRLHLDPALFAES